MTRSAWRALTGAILCLFTPSCFLFRVHAPVYDPVVLASGVVVQDLVVPEKGPVAQPGDRLTIDYEILLEDLTSIDSSTERGQPITFTMGASVLPSGLEQGLLGLRHLGRRRVWVPAELGYGEDGLPPRVPPNAALWFHVELIELRRGSDTADDESR